MMRYKTDYAFTWTYHEPNSIYCYTKTKHFESRIERNRFAVEVFFYAKSGMIVLEFAEKKDLQTWEK